MKKLSNLQPASALRGVTRSVALTALVMLAACKDEESAPVANYIRPVEIVTIASASPDRVYEFPGQIQASQQSNLAFEVPGKLTAIHVKEGDFVARDALVASLDASNYQATLNSAKATLEEAKLERERNQRLFEQDAGSKEAVEKSIRSVKTAEATFDTAQKAFNDTMLRAPFAGVVARVLVDDFENVAANRTIMVMQDTSSFEAIIAIPETLWVLAKKGLSNEERTTRARPEIRLTALRDTTFPARISETSMLADPKTRTFQVTLAFSPPAELNVSPGMTAAAILRWTDDSDENSSTFTVASTAVGFDEAGSAFVWRIDPQAMTASQLAVEVGEVTDNRIEIRGALANGDLLAASGIAQIREGMQVKRWEP
jgi:RND family efflux transporter MFP subunit